MVFVLNMINILIAGILASSVLATPLPATPSATADYSFSQFSSEVYSKYIVQDGDYLSKIAEAFYGNENYWTNLWNDNPEILDAALLEPGMILKIRSNKTVLPEILSLELEKRVSGEDTTFMQEAVAQSTNVTDDTTAVLPSVVPTAAPAVANVVASAPKSLTEEQITYLGSCEAGMDPAKNTGNGYYGAFQFSPSTWNSMGTGYARADLAPLEVQKEAVQRLVARSSIYTQFPGCAKKMRSIGMI